MFKRAVWFGSGVAVGVAGTVWTATQVRRAAAQLTPGGLADQLATRARRAGSRVGDAVAEGRRTRDATAAALRRELASPPAEVPFLTPGGDTGAMPELLVDGVAPEPGRALRSRR